METGTLVQNQEHLFTRRFADSSMHEVVARLAAAFAPSSGLVCRCMKECLPVRDNAGCQKTLDVDVISFARVRRAAG